MSEESLAFVIIAISLTAFAGFWLLVTSAITKMTPWGELQSLYPDNPSANAQRVFRFQSAYLGRESLGASFQGCLTVTVTGRGLRIAIWKVFAPFAKPILLPWEAIETQWAKTFLFSVLRLRVGPRGSVWITIAPRLARRIAKASDSNFNLPKRAA
ncbi:MAG: hypothetical protein AAFY81_09605 [Pseudomonadota bacterium]